MVTMEDIRRLPFANYDVLVYLGVGILAMPLLREFLIIPLGISLPVLTSTSDSPFVHAAFEFLYLLFTGYALGHVIAYLSSYFVEKFIHEWLRYPSDVWLSFGNRAGATRFSIFNSNINTTALSVASLVNALFHAPLWPLYALVHATGSFGFYTPKLDNAFIPLVKAKIAALGLPTPVTHRSKWAKTLEHYVANNSALGYNRLYNYLVIFGLLRSLAFLMIVLAWIRVLGMFLDAKRNVDQSVSGIVLTSPDLNDAAEYIVISIFATLTVMAFGKFNRRFFEECVYAFIMTKDDQAKLSPSTGT